MNDYTPTRFVDRERELKIVKANTDIISVNPTASVFQTVVNFIGGIRGMGVTTLLWDLHKRVRGEGFYSSFIDLTNERYSETNRRILGDIVSDLYNQYTIEPRLYEREAQLVQRMLKDQRVDERHEEKVREAFHEYLGKLSSQVGVLLFFDAVDRTDQTVMDWLEDEVLSPLVDNGRIVTILGSQRPLRWKKRSVRRHVKQHQLSPFSKEMTAEQIPEYSDLAGEIHSLTFGHPYSNNVIAGQLQRLEAEGFSIDPKTFTSYQVELMSHLVDEAVYPHVMRDASDQLKSIIRSISPLPVFDVEMLRYILSTVSRDFKDKPQLYFLHLIGSMVEAGLVAWDNYRKGYAIHPTLRGMLALDLGLREEGLYTKVRDSASSYSVREV